MYSNLNEKIEQIYIRFTEELPDPTSVCLFMKEIQPIIDEYEQAAKESIRWKAEDFISRAKEAYDFVDYTEDQAQEDLEEMIDSHDCNNGITWSTLDYYISQRIPKK
jgi:L-fucose mutarotase/ribose pyranase (RbsD/FucU family)